MVSYSSSPPPNKILCGDCKGEFKLPALKCQTCKVYYHTICAKMPLYYMVRYASSSVSFVCKLCTEKSAESHWTETAHLFKDCYPNLIDIEIPLHKNDTDVRVETESISPTNLSNSEESRQNFEDTSSTQEQDMQDKDIVQEEKCCRHGLIGNKCNFPHPAPCKKYNENPEN